MFLNRTPRPGMMATISWANKERTQQDLYLVVDCQGNIVYLTSLTSNKQIKVCQERINRLFEVTNPQCTFSSLSKRQLNLLLQYTFD